MTSWDNGSKQQFTHRPADPMGVLVVVKLRGCVLVVVKLRGCVSGSGGELRGCGSDELRGCVSGSGGGLRGCVSGSGGEIERVC